MTKRDREMSDKMGINNSFDLADQIKNNTVGVEGNRVENEQSTVSLDTELKQVNDFTKEDILQIPQEKKRAGMTYRFVRKGSEGHATAKGWVYDDVACLERGDLVLYCMPEAKAKRMRDAAVAQARRNEGSVDPYAVAERMGHGASPDLLPQDMRPRKQKHELTFEKEG